MGDIKFSIEDLEMLYMTEYDEDDVEEDKGDDVSNFLQWLKENYQNNK